jgi:hypothetical protein
LRAEHEQYNTIAECILQLLQHISTIPLYSHDPITALDVAIHRDDVPMIKFLIGKGGRAALPPQWNMKGRVYKYIRDADICAIPTDSTDIPTFAEFKAKYNHDCWHCVNL